MNVFRSRLLARLSEAGEWVDYRREASLWPFLLLPPLLSVAWAYGGTIGLGIVVAFGVGIAILALTATLCGAALWIVGNATFDALGVCARAANPSGHVRRRDPATSR